MQRYMLLPHTADISVRAQGSGRRELLQAAVRGMFAAAEPRYAKNGEIVKRKFDVEAEDFPSLLITVLNEAIFLSGMGHEAYDGVEITSLAKTKAHGIFKGRPVMSFGTEIKAATYHDLHIEKKDGVWEATIVFDV